MAIGGVVAELDCDGFAEAEGDYRDEMLAVAQLGGPLPTPNCLMMFSRSKSAF
jgi:hypothetical protein